MGCFSLIGRATDKALHLISSCILRVNVLLFADLIQSCILREDVLLCTDWQRLQILSCILRVDVLLFTNWQSLQISLCIWSWVASSGRMCCFLLIGRDYRSRVSAVYLKLHPQGGCVAFHWLAEHTDKSLHLILSCILREDVLLFTDWQRLQISSCILRVNVLLFTDWQSVQISLCIWSWAASSVWICCLSLIGRAYK